MWANGIASRTRCHAPKKIPKGVQSYGPWDEPASGLARGHDCYLLKHLGPVANVDWPVWTVEIKAIEYEILRDPFGYIHHVFILNDEIHRCAKTVANVLAEAVVFMCSMLVKLGRNPSRNRLCQFWGAESVGETNHAEV